jgi:acetylornithine deacetylase/succinyl-diaminopimelate desuccinylase-like protein
MLKPVFLIVLSVLFFFFSVRSQPDLQDTELLESTLPVSAAELLSQYVQVPSISGQEQAASSFLVSICEQSGLHICRFGTEKGHFNFAASLYPLEWQKPNLIFLNHLDVVPAGDPSRWTYPPFAGKIADGQVWGRGAFDNKGAAVMQLAAITRFVRLSQERELPFNITFLSVSCEEVQCEEGARYVAEHHLDELNPWVMIGEGPPALEGVIPSRPDLLLFGIATGHKRALWLQFDMEVSAPGHSSVPPETYANKVMLEALHVIVTKKRKAIYTPENVAILKELGRLEKGVKGFVLKHPKLFRPMIIPQLRKQPEVFALFSNTLSLTHLSNSGPVCCNAIPDHASCMLDCRLLPQTDEVSFLEDLQKRMVQEGISIEVMLHTPQTLPSPVDHPVYGLMQKAILDYFGPQTEVIPMYMPNISDSGWFRAKGVPVYDVIPARVSREHLHCIHATDERIPETALQEGSDVYASFLKMIIDWKTKDTELHTSQLSGYND